MKKLLIVTLFIAHSAGAVATPSVTDAARSQLDSGGIVNFRKVNDHLFRGARPETPADIQALERMGIRTVIDLQGGDAAGVVSKWVVPSFEAGETQKEIEEEKRWVEITGLRFVSRPMSSLAKVDRNEAQRISEILDLINDPENQPVFVHCAHGADRTGLVIALERVRAENWKPADAYAEMREMGHGFIHTLFTADLDVFFFAEALKASKNGFPDAGTR
jgi:tyrosine-protein phosphatase SIW14